MGDNHFASIEEADGVRLTWNVWPSTRLEAAKCVVPIAAVYSPVKALPNMPVVQYEPVPCKGCGAILNPYAAVDFAARLWTCALCHGRNHFPPHYAGASESNLPAELFPTCTTIEYQTPPPAPVQPPAYIFVVDTCLGEDELGHARRALSGALAALPEYAQVGLVTFGTHVAVHELGFPDMAKAYVFQGGREHSPAAVAAQLGLGPGGRPGAPPPPPRPAAGGGGPGAPPPLPPHQAAGRRFILPLSDAEFALTAALDDLARDAFPPLAECRPARCTGTAVSVAAALAAACLPPGLCAGRVLLFVGGPSTDGPGRVVERGLAEPIRSHKDLAKDAAPLFAKAAKFYAGVGAAMVGAGHALDVFACSLDQVGLAEMKPAIERTGGVAVQADTFANPVFRESLKRLLAPPSDAAAHLGTAAAATLEVIPSRDVRVAGALGPAAPADRRGPAVAETAVGMGGTSAWKLAGLDAATAVTLFFEPAAPGAAGRGGGEGGAGAGGHASQLYLQVITRYLHATGAPRTRVTTLTRRWTDGGDTAGLVAGFDQEAAAVVCARLATHKMETEEDFDATRWLDRTLIRLCARFGEYRRDDPASFALAPGLAFFPQFLFNLRRSAFVQVFGSSPDETAYARLWLGRAGVPDGMVMVQPTLLSYGLGSPAPDPVLLDVAAVSPDRVLLLDSFFHVVVFHGATVAQWRKAGYAADPAHAALAALLDAPRRDAAALCRARFPVPRLVDCDQHGSQARFLLAKLNPSATYNSSNGGGAGPVMGGPAVAGAEVILTDDVSLAVFMEHLKKLAVQS